MLSVIKRGTEIANQWAGAEPDEPMGKLTHLVLRAGSAWIVARRGSDLVATRDGRWVGLRHAPCAEDQSP